MTDKELLEWAAKAVGIPLDAGTTRITGTMQTWRPLTEDGDAFRLGVALDLLNDPRVISDVNVMTFMQNMPKLEATRRAITRVAAGIGRASQ